MQNVLNCFRVLEAVAEHQPVGPSQLTRLLDMPRTTIYRCLQTLQAAGWLTPSADENPRWQVTTRAFLVARGSPEHGLRQTALPIMQRLRSATDESVYLTVREGRSAVVIERLDSTKPVRTFIDLYARAPLHAASNGKAILAHLPADEIATLVSGDLERYTANTVCDARELGKQLESIRQLGYAVNMSEWQPEVCGVGAPILDTNRRPIGGLSVSMPATRFRQADVEEYGQLVRSAAQEVGLQLRSAAERA